MTRRLDTTFRFRLSTADRTALDTAAGKAGCSAAEIVRRAARGAPASDPETRGQIVVLRRELNGLGSNLNQLIHYANSGFFDAEAVETAVTAIADMRAEVTEALRR